MTALSDHTSEEFVEVLIVASNAEQTIADAILSIRETAPVSVLVIDNGCTDKTVERAQAAAASVGLSFRAVSLAPGATVGRARQAAIDHARSEYCIWLDADDRFCKGRVESLTSVLKDPGADYAFDGCITVPRDKAHDAETAGVRHAAPAFLTTPGAECHLYGRNWLPALTGAFRAAVARTVGYDQNLTSVEDYDHLLRAMLAGARIAFSEQIGYIYCEHHDTLSRDLILSRRNSAAVLSALPIQQVHLDMKRRGLPRAESTLVVAGILAQTGAWEELLQLCRSADREEDWSDVWRWDNRLRWDFFEANALLQSGQADAALPVYQRLVANGERAETLNNTGVCYADIGRLSAAETAWRRALSIKPNYADATINLDNPGARQLTVLPLRPAPIRDDYAL